MKNQINTKAGQIYNYLQSAWVQLLNPCAENPNPVYNKNNEMNYWDCLWFEHRDGKLWKSEEIAKIRFDGFGNPILVNALPQNKKHFLQHKSAGGCDGHRYSISNIVLTETNEKVGELIYSEYKYFAVVLNDGSRFDITSTETMYQEWINANTPIEL